MKTDKTEKILLIVNPVSGRMKSKTGLFEILDELYREEIVDPKADSSATGASTSTPALFAFGNLTPATLGGTPLTERRVTVLPTMYRGHAAETAARAAEEGYDTVICCGGDGTLNETVNGLMSIPADDRPALGYIPAGSTNDFAASVGLSSSLRGAARAAVSEQEMPLDIGLFRPLGQEAFPSRFFTYIASFGLFTAVSYSTPQSVKNTMGHLAYLLEGVRDLANIQPHHARVELSDGRVLEDDYVFGAVTNTTSAGGMVKLPADCVSMSDGELEVLLVHHPRTVTELNKIVTALLQQDFDGCPLIDFCHAERASFTLTEPLRWSLDGEEACGGQHVEILCQPAAVRLKK